jgi:uncharacterized protein
MIAIDTNLLVYAHRSSTPEHRAAQRAIEKACNDPRGCGIATASVAEFWGVVTHAKVPRRPSTPKEACDFLTSLVEQAGLEVWAQTREFGSRLAQVAADLGVRGNRIFDLQIALTAFENGATEIWTHDRDFSSLPALAVHDPL